MKHRVLLFAALVLLSLMFNLLVFPYLSEKTGGLHLLDTRFFYNPGSAADLLNLLGEEGRSWYLRMAGLADMLYPLAYGSLFVLLARWSSSHPLTLSLAFIAPAADIAENLATVIMLLRYPAFDQAVALAGSAFNGLKWIAVAGFMLMMVAAALRKLVSRMNKRIGQRNN